jgi:Ca-activated chloride channel homolog
MNARVRLMLVVIGGVTAMAVGAQQAPPQAAPQQPPQFRAGTRTVTVPVSVTDRNGEFMRDLVKEDFDILDNGVTQPITFFDRQIQPITAVLLLDASASMLVALKPAIAAVNEFIVRLMPGDRLRSGTFAEDIRLDEDFTGDRDALLALFANEFNVRIGRRTRLWDAMDEGLDALGGIEGRRILIVVSDGQDTMSTMTFDAVRAKAQREGVAIYFARFFHRDRRGQILELSTGPDGSSPGRASRIPPGAFEDLARETGGEVLTVEQDYVTLAPFTQVALDLHSQYVLGFTPQVLDGRMHKLEVRVKRTGLAVRARKTYIASE